MTFDHDHDLDHDIDHDLDHDLDHDKQHPCFRQGAGSGVFFLGRISV